MESNVNKDPNISDSSDSSTAGSAAITTLSPSAPGQTTDTWPDNNPKLNTFMQEFPNFLVGFWIKYRLPFVMIGVVLVLIIFTKILIAVLAAINELPLLEPFFEIIGISYFSWFLIRYLLPSSGREELGESIQSLADRVKGNAPS